jgi:thiamine-monophosphate kinase
MVKRVPGGALLKLRELGEFGLIELIRQKSPTAPGVHRGIGDDAAEISLPEGHHLLTSTDLLIEGIHFRRDWTDAEDLGHKAVAVNLSDIAAMGGTPRYLYLGLACPGDTDLDEIIAFLNGALDEAARHDVALVGGDTCRSPGPWLISVTIEGSAPARQAIGRDGAQPGDLIMVSGTLGDSALALQLLREGQTPEADLLARHHRPTARVELGRRLAEGHLATAMIDISDGLASDLEHILHASGVDGIIEERLLPLSAAFLRSTDDQPALRQLAVHGGEDYELLFTVPRNRLAEAAALGAELRLSITRIGIIREGSGRLSLLDDTGSKRPLRVRGYDHFCHS